MVEDQKEFVELYSGLANLAAGDFPKTCPTCGREYKTFEEYIEQTVPLANKSGLKGSEDDDGKPIVEVFRNCVCGSTLLDFAQSRRDHSERGEQRRQKFDKMLAALVRHGIEQEVARQELRKVINGIKSEVIDTLLRSK